MPRFGSLQSLEQLDAVATRYHCLPSDLLRRSYAEYCLDAACALAGEAKESRLIVGAAPQAAPQAAPPPRRVEGLMVGAFSRDV